MKSTDFLIKLQWNIFYVVKIDNTLTLVQLGNGLISDEQAPSH